MINSPHSRLSPQLGRKPRLLVCPPRAPSLDTAGAVAQPNAPQRGSMFARERTLPAAERAELHRLLRFGERVFAGAGQLQWVRVRFAHFRPNRDHRVRAGVRPGPDDEHRGDVLPGRGGDGRRRQWLDLGSIRPPAHADVLRADTGRHG